MSSGSQPGERRGGRAPGTPNKRTVELVERLAELECDPVEGLVRIAADPNIDATLRARVYADLLSYMYPKHKVVELSSTEASGTNCIRILWGSEQVPEDAIDANPQAQLPAARPTE